MKRSTLAITATLSELEFLENIVIKLAGRRQEMGYTAEKVQVGWNALGSSSIEAYVSGDINISNNADLLNMPFTTCFLFTCIKTKRSDYSLTFVSSLS
ncbi:MAG TPA: hypothetical protein VLJ68_03140 [Chitinophagaceae bacterium]|nr:hypothetical protein [Chitinophagaceae bacterium]